MKYTFAIDLMSGETGPEECLKGVIKYAKEFPNDKCIIIGQKTFISQFKNKLPSNIGCHYSTDIVTMEDDDPMIFRLKPNSSLSVGLKLLNNKKYQIGAFISSVNTMAYLTAAFLISKPIIPELIPALAGILPISSNGFKTILDCGAVVDREAKDLAQVAIMGSYYHKAMFNVDHPRIALLSNGVEDFKGNKLTKETKKLLQINKKINFKGLVEPTTLFENNYEVLIGDGFTINILGKTIIATSTFVSQELKKSLSKTWVRKFHASFLRPAFKELKETLTSRENIGGGVMLGLNHIIIKSPGYLLSGGYYNALKIAHKLCERNIVSKIKKALVENG